MNDILVECSDDVRTSEVECMDELNQKTGLTDIWRTRYLGQPYPLTKVEFDDVEQAMIREMAHKVGYPRNDIVRQAVRDLYFHMIISHGGK